MDVNPSRVQAGLLHGKGRAILRHLPFVILLLLLVAHCTQTFGIYLAKDDINWLRRTVADSDRPWNALVEPLYSNYYRPVIHAIWLLNYTVWGFEYAGYQLTLVLIWLAGVALLYGAGLRIGGRTTALLAALPISFNDIYLLLASWKSWVTVLAEFALVVAWFWCFVAWIEGRKRKHLLLWVILAVLATLSKESAPLIVAAGVFVAWVWPETDGASRASWRPVLFRGVIWGVASLAILLALPSYRGALVSALGTGAPSPEGPKEISLAYVVPRFVSHSESMFRYGLHYSLLLFALLAALWKRKGMKERRPRTWHKPLLGAVVLGLIVVSLPAGGAIWEEMGGVEIARQIVWPVMFLLLCLGFVLLALSGDRVDRILGAWFLVALLPFLLFRVGSNAYHMLALAAVVLWTARVIGDFIRDEAVPVWRRWLSGKVSSQEPSRGLLILLFTLLLGMQAFVLLRNYDRVHNPDYNDTVPARVAAGRRAKALVETAREALLTDPGPGRTVYLANDRYEWVVATELRARHDFDALYLHDLPETLVGLRRFDSPLQVYSDALPYDRKLFSRHSILPAGLEGADSDGRALVIRNPSKTPLRDRRGVTLVLEEGTPVVFGGFLHKDAAAGGRAWMSFVGPRETAYVRRTIPAWNDRHWTFHWACAVAPSNGPVRFNAIEVRDLGRGAARVQDIFLCPVEPLIEHARRRPAGVTIPDGGHGASSAMSAARELLDLEASVR